MPALGVCAFEVSASVDASRLSSGNTVKIGCAPARARTSSGFTLPNRFAAASCTGLVASTAIPVERHDETAGFSLFHAQSFADAPGSIPTTSRELSPLRSTSASPTHAVPLRDFVHEIAVPPPGDPVQ